MAIDPQIYKQAMAQWASGVTVVTTRLPDGEIKGMTASSFTSVSINPYLILICVAKKLYTHEVLLQSDVFAVNILNSTQAEIAQIFAGMRPDITDRFGHIGYTTSETGSPILPDVAGWLDCKKYQVIDAGDHTIFIGEVLSAYGTSDKSPLIYFNRQWGSFAPNQS
ncbi:MAG: flavin reductase family protein [Anaerolineae bacterium]|nr:flavin reductase family protein [Anaerolineae bacterium]